MPPEDSDQIVADEAFLGLSETAKLWSIVDRQGRSLEQLTPAMVELTRAKTVEAQARAETWSAMRDIIRGRMVQMGVGIGITALMLGATFWLFRWDPTPVLDRMLGECVTLSAEG